MTNNKKILLTGDRPTGPLHLGHFVGSLQNRVRLQDEYDCYFIIADYQFLTDHLKLTEMVEENSFQIVLDWLSVGLDPEKSTFFIQSRVPEIADLTMYFSMLVTLPRLQRNPTVKEEIQATGLSEISYGFMGYPVSQAADILIVRAELVPVGEDNLPHIEQTREIARSFNRLFPPVFPIPEPLLSQVSRLPGLNGQKMSKSRGNSIYLKDSPQVVDRKISQAVTDPLRVRVSDPGRPEMCTIFKYYQAFYPEITSEIADSCRHASTGCVSCKKSVALRINQVLDPIREKRASFEYRRSLVKEALQEGIARTRRESLKTLDMVKKAMHYDYSRILV